MLQTVGIISSIILCTLAIICNPVSTHAISLAEVTESLPIVGGLQQSAPKIEAAESNTSESQVMQMELLSPVTDIVPPIIAVTPSQSESQTQPLPQPQVHTQENPSNELPVELPIQLPSIISNPVTPTKPIDAPKTTRPQATPKPLNATQPEFSSQMNTHTTLGRSDKAPASTTLATPVASEFEQNPRSVTAETDRGSLMAQYMSEKISREERDGLYKASLIIATTGLMALLLTVTSVRDRLNFANKFRNLIATNN